MTPIHIPKLDDDRAALAPYNFVPLPEQVVPAEALPEQDRYHPDRFTGRIECVLTTASPLYVRCGLTPEQLAAGLEAKDLPEFFFTADAKRPVIPGSSLRGMLRALVEIVGYGKMERVTERPRFFYRAVAAKSDDPLAMPYRSQLRNVKAGYITQRGDSWAIVPAKPLGTDSFIKVRERDIPATLGLVRMHDPSYRLQRIAVSFTHKRTPAGRTVVDLIGPPGVHEYAGTLVTSGNMLETGRPGQRTQRKNHVVVPDAEAKANPIPIAPQAVEDYCNGLSSFVAEQLGPLGVLAEGMPVFYCEPGGGKREVTAFGHNPNFRLPYRFPGSDRAATPRDFVPKALYRDTDLDLAEAIFGMVRSQRQADAERQAVAGRVFVSDAKLIEGQGDPWLSSEPFTPHILTGPKPTTFQHYLVQPQSAKPALKHYAHRPGEETAIRGHKLYWHKGTTPELRMPADKLQTASDTQTTAMHPVRAGVQFEFTLHYENLSEVELGALLWVLRLGSDPAYRLKLGMGKPLGMGAVGLVYRVVQSRREERYQSLFADGAWALGEHEVSGSEQEQAIEAFEAYVLAQSAEQQRGYSKLAETLRIRCLLALLGWPGPLPEQTRYMEIERTQRPRLGNDPNEYKDRRVLPLATQVAGITLSAAEIMTSNASQAASPTPSTTTAPPPAKPVASTGSNKLAVGEVFRGKIIGPSKIGIKIEHPAHPDTKKVIGLVAKEQQSGPFKPDQQRWFEIIGIEREDATTILWLKPTSNPNRKEKEK
ncbi:TIGR03986 family type III CRISPR-associated RAMP protein [Candidatus Viridilinea mediisalina]|uniref:TIGR03986 family CRISPR-associated RAMP protein n=1 Tax=Candidatus Viridilinea mediisalina TaxID=2024553 RepID=A0A2A6RGH1_9CHLR|nr:TIGR03986 family CRISPR-associated RAMP protein [Candidatus Viridilinea mediisalina]PDW01978.1 TIGR03986 family CRISPR-associated RAMP protein [Candidatus Viridilinea mediisalina]